MEALSSVPVLVLVLLVVSVAAQERLHIFSGLMRSAAVVAAQERNNTHVESYIFAQAPHPGAFLLQKITTVLWWLSISDRLYDEHVCVFRYACDYCCDLV